MSVVLDDLDKKLLHELCSGVRSYDELARLCKVTRGTIYRRIAKLEKMQVITKMIRAIPDLAKLNLSAICIGTEVAYENMDKAVDLLKALPNVKFLWKTYGAHQIIIILICEKGCEGDAINEVRQALMNLNTGTFHISIGFAWEKMDFAPF